LVTKKRGANINLGQQHSVEIRMFYDCWGQNSYFGYICPCQIPAYQIIYDADASSYFLRNIIFKGTNQILSQSDGLMT